MLRQFLILIFFYAFIVVSCNIKKNAADNLQVALKNAGSNKAELLQVLALYNNPKDSLKLKAVKFLILNMDQYYSFKGGNLEGYNKIFAKIDTLDRLKCHLEYDEIEKIIDSTRNVFGPLALENLDKVKDLETITSSFLIENIESSFHTWKNSPWAKKLSFNEFCEYILPYRYGNSPLQYWRSYLYIKYKYIEKFKDPVEAVVKINGDIVSWLKYDESLTPFNSSVSLSDIFKGKRAICIQEDHLKTAVLRAIGIPNAIDFTPQFGNHSGGHDWNTIFDSSGTPYSFASFYQVPQKKQNPIGDKLVGKVYRKTFAKQENSLMNQKGFFESIPPAFSASNFIDVTMEYPPVSSVKVPITKSAPFFSEHIYLCVFDNKEWTAIAWTKNTNKETALFENLKRGILYMPMYYQFGRYLSAGNPFILQGEGQVTPVVPDKKTKAQMVVRRKYFLHQKFIDFANLLKDGCFEGSNTPTFDTYDTLFQITASPSQAMEEVKIASDKKYRYVRFRSDKIGWCLAEMQLYTDQNTVPEQARFIGKNCSKENPVSNAFDKSNLSYFDSHITYDAWIGLDLGKAKKITQINYLSRTDLNAVQPGDEYELFYWDDRWVSLGKQVAKKYYLIYKNAPKNALFWLKDLNGGKEERIFTYGNNNQIWW
jgi:hypothetical protein